jgi:hypothetical protein
MTVEVKISMRRDAFVGNQSEGERRFPDDATASGGTGVPDIHAL